MVRAAIFALCAVLIAPVQAETVSAKRDNPDFRLTVTFLPESEVAARCAQMGAWGGDLRAARRAQQRGPIGCAAFYPESKRCEVFVVRPETVDDERTRTLGHEVLHCVLGPYHETNH